MSHLQTSAPLQNSLVTELEQLQAQITDIERMSEYRNSVIKAYLSKMLIFVLTYSISEKLKDDGVMDENHQSCLLIGTILGLLLLNQPPTKPQITGFSEKRAQANLSGSLKALAATGDIKKACLRPGRQGDMLFYFQLILMSKSWTICPQKEHHSELHPGYHSQNCYSPLY